MAAPATFSHMPSHDPQKLMRAALASSCLRGEMRVWQFQPGKRGEEIRNSQLGRAIVLRAGHVPAFLRCPEHRQHARFEMRRPFDAQEYTALADAVGLGQCLEAAEWVMDPTQPRQCMGLEIGWITPDMAFQAAKTSYSRLSSQQSDHGLVAPVPLTILLTACVRTDWVWGVRRVVALLAQLHDRGDRRWLGHTCAIAAACAGTPRSLHWVQHFWGEAFSAQLAPEYPHHPRPWPFARGANRAEFGAAGAVGDRSALLRHNVLASCSVAVLEWILDVSSHRTSGDTQASRSGGHDSDSGVVDEYVVRHALLAGNLPVLRWLARHGRAVHARRQGRILFENPTLSRSHTPRVVNAFADAEIVQLIVDTAMSCAARNDVAALEFLLTQWTYSFQRSTMHAIASTGSLEVMRYLCDVYGAEPLWTSSVALTVAASTRRIPLPLLEWATLQHGLDPPLSTRTASHVSVAEFICKHAPVAMGFADPASKEALHAVCRGSLAEACCKGNVQLLDFLWSRIANPEEELLRDLDYARVIYIIQNGDLPMIQRLRGLCPCIFDMRAPTSDTDTDTDISTRGDAFGAGVTEQSIDARRLEAACRSRNVAMVRYVCNEWPEVTAAPAPYFVLNAAAVSASLEVCEFVYHAWQGAISWPESALIATVRRGHPGILEFMVERCGARCTSDVLQNAMNARQLHMVEMLIERGWCTRPDPPSTNSTTVRNTRSSRRRPPPIFPIARYLYPDAVVQHPHPQQEQCQIT